MTDVDMLKGFLAGAAVFALRPDYRALLLAVDGLVPGPSDQDSDALLQAAETSPPRTERAAATAWRHCCAPRNRGCPA
jgi:hypothetical protein